MKPCVELKPVCIFEYTSNMQERQLRGKTMVEIDWLILLKKDANLCMTNTRDVGDTSEKLKH
jgi:hypothetical protein